MRVGVHRSTLMCSPGGVTAKGGNVNVAGFAPTGNFMYFTC